MSENQKTPSVDEIERDLSEAVAQLVPEDMFQRISDNIDSAPSERARKVIMSTNNSLSKKRFRKNITSIIIAASILLCTGIFGVPYYSYNYVPDSIVDIDVNPSIELVTNTRLLM